MKIDLNKSELEKVNNLNKTHDMNSDVLQMFANYLRNNSRFITKDLVFDIVDVCNVSEEYAFFVLLAAACGLEIEENDRDMIIAKNYFVPSIKKLEVKAYKENLYYKNIKIPEVKVGDWELKYEKYDPYESFIYNDINLCEDYKEIPRLGFFDEEFLFPAVLESNIEWMTITPNEIETMQPAVEEVKGKVVTFGLGLGYFAYMVSEKSNVESITIIEKDEEVIQLFQNYILPQFAHKDKVTIICEDAFEYADKCMKEEGYDYAFVDLWHDASDGVEPYLRMKKLEHLDPKTKYLYWIEETLLSNLRWHVFEVLLGRTSGDRRYNLIANYLEGETLRTYDDYTYYLSNSFLKKLAMIVQ